MQLFVGTRIKWKQGSNERDMKCLPTNLLLSL